jgi:hypothetical protein
VHTGAKRSLGTVQLAGLPAQVVTDGKAPSGWSSDNYLIKLTNYADQVTAESGVGSTAPTATQSPASGSSGPTLSYWNGSGYTNTTVNWGSNPPSITVPDVNITDGSVTVFVSTTVAAGAATTARDTPSGCSATCSANATVASPVAGDIVYTVKNGSTTLCDLDVSFDLGTLGVQTTYRAAPSAS